MHFFWVDGDGAATGHLWLAHRRSLCRLSAVETRGSWVAWVQWLWDRPEPVAGPFPDLAAAKAAAEAFVRGLPDYLGRLMGGAA